MRSQQLKASSCSRRFGSGQRIRNSYVGLFIFKSTGERAPPTSRNSARRCSGDTTLTPAFRWRTTTTRAGAARSGSRQKSDNTENDSRKFVEPTVAFDSIFLEFRGHMRNGTTATTFWPIPTISNLHVTSYHALKRMRGWLHPQGSTTRHRFQRPGSSFFQFKLHLHSE